jgi:cytochrome c oxidase cbb3-type subunit 3
LRWQRISETGDTSLYDVEKIIRYGIRSGHPKTWNLAVMPAYGSAHPSATEPSIPQLSKTEIDDLVEYLFFLEKRSANAVAAKRGAALYGNKAGCFDCHAGDGGGDLPIGAPSLTDGIWLYGMVREARCIGRSSRGTRASVQPSRGN